MSKSRLSRVEMQARLHAARSRPGKTLERFREAAARGLIHCKDGKDRTPEEWIAYLPADLGETMREALADDEN